MKSRFIEPNLRLVFGKLVRGILLLVGVLVALSVAGIDLHGCRCSVARSASSGPGFANQRQLWFRDPARAQHQGR